MTWGTDTKDYWPLPPRAPTTSRAARLPFPAFILAAGTSQRQLTGQEDLVDGLFGLVALWLCVVLQRITNQRTVKPLNHAVWNATYKPHHTCKALLLYHLSSAAGAKGTGPQTFTMALPFLPLPLPARCGSYRKTLSMHQLPAASRCAATLP